MTKTITNQSKPKPHSITIKVKPAEYTAISDKAAACGLPIAEFVRRCTLGRRAPSRAKLLVVDELRRLGELQQRLAEIGDVRRQRYVVLLADIRSAIQRVAVS
jgi:hypothetical protein